MRGQSPKHRRMRSGMGRIAATACVSVILVVPSTALGQTNATDAYNSPGGSVQQQVGNHHSGLPFTGLDVGLAGTAGAVLLAMGIAIRLLSRIEPN